MGRNETEKKNEGLSSIKKRDETNEKSERKPYTSRRGRPSRSSTRSATPPKKKHRPDDPSSAKEVCILLVSDGFLLRRREKRQR